MTSDWIYYFGYGSLVNRDTRPEGEFTESARLKGWQRVWEHRTADPERQQQCTSLSIEPIDTSDCAGIEGVVARIPVSALAELDKRESGYERLRLSAADFDLPASIQAESVFVYRSLPHNRHLANDQHPILQSYIDCVLAGYRTRFGDAGMRAMFDTTRGWNRPILNDRAAPYYPRWVSVAPEVTQQLDLLIQSCSESVRQTPFAD
ncbi:MAG: gamma-glutamylcyclotransferase family protein [Granulosicoccus sp.]